MYNLPITKDIFFKIYKRYLLYIILYYFFINYIFYHKFVLSILSDSIKDFLNYYVLNAISVYIWSIESLFFNYMACFLALISVYFTKFKKFKICIYNFHAQKIEKDELLFVAIFFTLLQIILIFLFTEIILYLGWAIRILMAKLVSYYNYYSYYIKFIIRFFSIFEIICSYVLPPIIALYISLKLRYNILGQKFAVIIIEPKINKNYGGLK